MALLDYLSLVPLAITIGLLASVALSRFSPRLRGLLTRIALAGFRSSVEREGRHRIERKRNLQSIHSKTTYPVYAARTILYSVLVGVSGAIVGIYVVAFALPFFKSTVTAIRSTVTVQLRFAVPGQFSTLPGVELLVLFLGGSLVIGLTSMGATYYGRWWRVASTVRQREIMIDESVARTISFVYALSRSGMIFPEIMRTVGDNRKAFGESAEEIGVVVKDMDLFGADLVTALKRIASRTPSEQFADFAENFANALQGGQNISRYLREQYDQYQADRVANQERLLELFTALGEGYVAGLVAGPLFLLTVLTIFGLLTGGFTDVIAAVVYLLVPLGNLGFLIYLASISESLTTYQAPIRQGVKGRPLSVRRAVASPRPDGGTAVAVDNVARLAAYNRLRGLRRAVTSPFETAVARPRTLLYVTVPFAATFLVLRAWPMLEFGIEVRLLDDMLIQSTLFVVGTFAVVQEIHSRQIRSIEGAIPDLLERLASTNEAGLTFTESIKRVDRSDLGPLNIEVERLLADVEWGARTEMALNRFNDRIGSATVARIVALLTNAMAASGDLGPVIRIAADEAREDRRLKRKRRQEMFMYVVIIYLSFIVFLGIAIALQTILIPAIPSAEQLGGFAASPVQSAVNVNLPISPVAGAAKGQYTVLLFHAAVVQSVASGFVAGQMGQGNLADGAKHVAILLAAAYAVFLFVM